MKRKKERRKNRNEKEAERGRMEGLRKEGSERGERRRTR